MPHPYPNAAATRVANGGIANQRTPTSMHGNAVLQGRSRSCCCNKQQLKCPNPHATHRGNETRMNSGIRSSKRDTDIAVPSSSSPESSLPANLNQEQPVSPPVSSSNSNWQQSALQNPPMLSVFAGVLFQTGAVLGTLLDGIHSRTGLQVYDLAPVQLGPLSTSALVPPLLGTFYVVLGFMTCTADNLFPGPATVAAKQRAEADLYVALCFGALAAALTCSAVLYEHQWPRGEILALLAGISAVNWAMFDRTMQGLVLAVVCGLGAPAAEVVLMAASHCWHYSRPDLGGIFVSWVPLCYFFYTPAVSNLARYLWQTCRLPDGGAD